MKNLLLIFTFFFAVSAYSQETLSFEALVYMETQDGEIVDISDSPYKMLIDLGEDFFIIDNVVYDDAEVTVDEEEGSLTYLSFDGEVMGIITLDVEDGSGVFSHMYDDDVLIYAFRVLMDSF